MELKKWTKSHFFAYILLSIAHADNNIDKEELDSIKNYIENLNFDNHANVLGHVLPVFLQHSSDLRANFVKTKWKLFFESEEEVGNILDEIEEMILVDNKIDLGEIKTYGSIRKALNICDHD